MTDYALVLSALRPNASWMLDGEDYSGLTWLSDSIPPSRDECDNAWPQVQHDLAREQVRKERHAAYGSPDGSDAIFLQWQRGTATEQEWLDAVQAVKDAHPYPDPL
jgi:hypothetical protein